MMGNDHVGRDMWIVSLRTQTVETKIKQDIPSPCTSNITGL